MFIRYYGIVLIATDSFLPFEAFGVFAMYPLQGVLVLSVKGKFGGYKNKFVKKYLLDDYNKLKTFRIKYYGIGLVVCLSLYCTRMLGNNILYAFVYYFIFCVVSHLIDIKKGKVTFD